jgi:hypothetical protein
MDVKEILELDFIVWRIFESGFKLNDTVKMRGHAQPDIKSENQL